MQLTGEHQIEVPLVITSFVLMKIQDINSWDDSPIIPHTVRFWEARSLSCDIVDAFGVCR